MNEASPFQFLNGVYRTQLEARDADDLMRDIHDEYASKKIAYRWYEYPHSGPGDLASRLQKLGPASITEMSGLVFDTRQKSIEVPIDVTVEEVGESNLEDYIAANLAGWNQTGAEGEKVRRSILSDFAKSDRGYRAFLARYKGHPASTGMLRIVNGSGYLLGGSTNSSYRGRGVYRGLVAHRLELIRSLGMNSAFVLARKSTSAPICLKLGFELACECKSYDFAF